MDRSQVRALVADALPGLLTRLGLAHWRVEVAYDLRADCESFAVLGRCTRIGEYNGARIELDADALATEADVLRTLRHELLHVVLAPLDLYRATLAPLFDETSSTMAEVIWSYCIEKTVVNLERMVAGLTAAEQS